MLPFARGQAVPLSCRWSLKPECFPPLSCREFVSLFDWRNTSASGLDVSVWVNNSNVALAPQRGTAPPDLQRWPQVCRPRASSRSASYNSSNQHVRVH